MSRPALRVTTVAAALVAATALSGCGDTSGGTAASYQGEKVSNEDVQQAVKDITTEPDGKEFDSLSAAIFLVLGPQLDKLAKEYGVYASTDVARRVFKVVKDPSEAGIRTVQGSMNFGNLRQSDKGGPALQKLFKQADVKLNPRYGTWVKGTGPGAVQVNWIKSSTRPATS